MNRVTGHCYFQHEKDSRFRQTYQRTLLMEVFQAGYTSIHPMNFEAVLPFYSFTDAFNCIGWCRRRGLGAHRDFLGENVERLKKFVAYDE